MVLGARFSMFTTILAAAAIGFLALAGGSSAHEAAADDGPGVPDSVADALGGDVTELPDDLYRVDLRHGPSLTTHGPDTPAEIRLDHGNSLSPGDPERSPVCATDYYQQVLYAHRASDPDRLATVTAQIQASMRRMDAVLNEDSLEAGGVSADYKVHCDASGAIDVQSFSVGGTSFSSVVSAARAAGYNASNVDYTIFFDYDDPNVCGTGSFSADERLTAANVNNTGGDYGVTYSDCWNGATPMHENGHNEGAVQYNAPYSTGSGAHCWDENDVMCYSPDGGNIHQNGTISRCTDRLHFDCGNDSYFDPAPESCEYLATNWNLGSRLNRFIAFGPGSANTPPCATFSSICSDLSCAFADSSSDPEGAIASRSWTFGDGGASTAINPTHSYETAGTYDVTLTVTDAMGATHTTSRSISVGSQPPGDGGSAAPSPGNAGPGAVDPADAGPPDTAIIHRPRDRTRRRKASIEFSSSEAGSTFECSLDSGPFRSCSSPQTVKVKRGHHSFAVRAIDAGGSADPTPATASWTVSARRR